jgi:hypothetical protein
MKDLIFNVNYIQEIENLVQDKNIQYIDAIVHYSEKSGLEIEFLASIIKKDPVMKSKLQFEAENLNFMKKNARLPM